MEFEGVGRDELVRLVPKLEWVHEIDLGGGILLPVHWATFNLSYHAWDEPILRTLRAAEAEHVQLVTPRVGEVVEVGQPFNNVGWYRGAR
jgi:hypothetical protein